MKVGELQAFFGWDRGVRWQRRRSLRGDGGFEGVDQGSHTRFIAMAGADQAAVHLGFVWRGWGAVRYNGSQCSAIGLTYSVV
jgi:hypothetical protein